MLRDKSQSLWVIPGGVRGPYGMPGIKPKSPASKTSAFHCVFISLLPKIFSCEPSKICQQATLVPNLWLYFGWNMQCWCCHLNFLFGCFGFGATPRGVQGSLLVLHWGIFLVVLGDHKGCQGSNQVSTTHSALSPAQIRPWHWFSTFWPYRVFIHLLRLDHKPHAGACENQIF